MAQVQADTSHLLTAAEFGNGLDVGLIPAETHSLFKPLKTIPLALLQIVLNVILLLESIIFLNLVDYCDNERTVSLHFTPTSENKIDCTAIVIYSVIIVWILTWLLKAFFRILHKNHRRYGYLKLYSEIQHLTNLPFDIMTIGNSALLVAVTLKMDNFIPARKVIHEPLFWLLIQIVCGIELVIIFTLFAVYIVRVTKFNRAQPDPDVFHENALSAMPLIMNARTAVAVGPGVSRLPQEVTQLQSVCERQADLIEYLRHRCDVLSGRLYRVSNDQS